MLLLPLGEGWDEGRRSITLTLTLSRTAGEGRNSATILL